MSRGLKILIGAVVVIGGVTAAQKMAANRNKATEVRVDSVTARDLVSSVTASGQIQPRIKVDVAADISGRIVRLAVKEGQEVRKGQFLLEIDPEQYLAAVQRSSAAVASSRASLTQSEANLQQAVRNYERSLGIQKTNPQLIAAEQLEQLKTAVEVNEALTESARQQVDQANASLKEARSNLARTRIMSPMNGRISRLVVEEGETAVPGNFNRDAAILLTVADLSVFETKVKVDETDVARLSIGDSTIVQIDAFPDTTFVGKVVEIANSAVLAAAGSQDQAIDYEVTIQLLNAPPDTRPDFSATAKIVTDVRNQVLSIPIIALTVRENQNLAPGDTAVGVGGRPPVRDITKRDVEGVFVVGEDNKVTFRPVKVGIAGDRYFEVLSGLKANEKIVGGTYQAIRELKDGTLVKQAKDESKTLTAAKS